MEEIKNTIRELSLRIQTLLKIGKSLGDIGGRDEVDQQLTSILATIAEFEAHMETEAERVQQGLMAQSKSLGASENGKKASEEWFYYKYLKLLREAIVEHIRGLRSHSKREFQERLINEA